MLLAIKDKIKGVLGFVVIGLITIPFTLWGIQSYLGDDTPLFVASVNDAEISTQEFNAALSRIRQNLQEKYDGKIPFEENELKNSVIEQLINQRLLQEVSYTNGYRVSDLVLSAEINKNENFQRDGKFDKEFYNAILASNGRNSVSYENSLRSEMQVNQFQYSILKSGFATEKELKEYANLDQQTREFSYAVFDQNNTDSKVDISDEDIEQYYNTNSDQFMNPEQVKIEYVEVKSEDFLSEIEVDENRIAEMYQAYTADILQREERKTRHILMTAKEGEDKSVVIERLQDIKSQIINGASFEKLANEFSQDVGSATQGGDLDWVARGQMPKPFDTALFALQKGGVSEIVETQFGFHLIKLDDMKSDDALTLSEKRDGFIEELKTDSVDDKFYDVTENLAALAYENIDNLNVPSEVLGLEIKTTQLFTHDSGQGITEKKDIRDSAFSDAVLNGGENSEVIELSSGHVLVLRLLERVPANLKPIASVTADIRNLLEERNKSDKVFAAANAARLKIIDGSVIDEVVPKGVSIKKTGPVKRQDISAVDLKILDAGFKMVSSDDKNNAVAVVNVLSGGAALVVLDKINHANIEDKTLLATNKQLISNLYSNADFNAVLASITSNANIIRNSKVLEQ